MLLALAGLSILATRPAFAEKYDKTSSSGEVTIADRKLACNGVSVSFDPSMPMEGASIGPHIVLNPHILDEHPEAVRWFVFYHECGHFSEGASEFAADRYALERGLREGWLDKKVLVQVCQSFGDTPDLPSHPSGRRRCKSLNEHFAKVVASNGAQPSKSKTMNTPSSSTRAADTTAKTPAAKKASFVPTPELVALLPQQAARERVATPRSDPIGELIEKVIREPSVEMSPPPVLP